MRERRVVNYAARGHTNKWIAFELEMTPSTVGSHIARAIRKLELRCRVDLAPLLFERGRADELCRCGAKRGGPVAANDVEDVLWPK